MTAEEEYKKELAENGVILEEEKKPEDDKVPENKQDDPPKDPEPPKELLQTKPKEPEQTPRKRSIYDDYKDQKKDLKSEKERRETAEKERDELAEKLRIATDGKGADIEAGDDAIAYAKKVGADPVLVQRIIDESRKGLKPEIDETLKKGIEEFQTWKTQNSKVIEQQMFDDEFKRTTPAIKELFPSVSAEELDTLKTELDRLSHTKEWHDKDLEYVAYKNKDTLSALVSPKKRGMEGKGRKEEEPTSNEFDPKADYSKMSLKERAAWEKQYNEQFKSDGLVTDSQGRKLLI